MPGACRRHRQYLEHTIVKFDQLVCLVRQLEVLFYGPQALEWQEVDLLPIGQAHELQFDLIRVRSHKHVPTTTGSIGTIL